MIVLSLEHKGIEPLQIDRGRLSFIATVYGNDLLIRCLKYEISICKELKSLFVIDFSRMTRDIYNECIKG